MTNREYILNTIAKKVSTINDLKKIKENVNDSIGDDNAELNLFINTEHTNLICGLIDKRKHKLSASKYAIKLILDEAINKEKERIDKLIDKLIEEETKNENNA